MHIALIACDVVLFVAVMTVSNIVTYFIYRVKHMAL